MGTVKSALIEQVEGLALPFLARQGYELVDLQFVHEHGQWVLRFFVDKPGGVTLDDCAVISEQIGRHLDATDLISHAYSLEVSSPGINRPLKKESDYRRFAGERVDVTLYAPLNGRRHFRGTIRGVKDGVVAIEEAGGVFALPLADVAKAKLDPEISI